MIENGSNCYECEKGLNCGWSIVDPMKPHLIVKSSMINKPCENFCKKYSREDYYDVGLENLIIGIAKFAADDYIRNIQKQERALLKIEMLKAYIKERENDMHIIAQWLPCGVPEKLAERVKEGGLTVKQIQTTKLALDKLYAKREMLISDIDKLEDNKAALYASLTSGTSSLNGMPHGGNDVHKFDEYAMIAVDLNCKIDELIALNTKIKGLQDRLCKAETAKTT